MIDSAALERARSARAELISKRSTADLVRALADAAAIWASPESPDRCETVADLREALALDVAMIERGLDLIFGAINEEAMAELIAGQAGSPAALDETRIDADGCERRLLGPDTIYHSLAGNIPGLAIPALVCGVLARSVTLLRDSRRQPVLTQAFLATLAGIDPLAAALVVPVPADVDSITIRSILGNEPAAVELHGSDAVIDELTESFAGFATTRHGSRVSALLATADAKPVEWVGRIAHDITMYEGLGCLTPHTIIVEREGTAEGWANALAVALSNMQKTWPRHRQSLELEAARRAFLEHAEVSSLLPDARPLLRGADDCWCITQSSAPTLSTGPGMRCVTVIETADREQSLAAFDNSALPIAAIGLTMHTDSPTMPPAEENLRHRLEASLVCSAGYMQAPPLAWQQDGRRRLGDLLDWRPSAS